MSITKHLGAALATALLVATATSGASAQPVAIAAAGSPLVIPAMYTDGIVRAIDRRANTITVGEDVYRVTGTKVPNVRVGDSVTVAHYFVHYGPAAWRFAVGVQRKGKEGPKDGDN